MHWRITYITYRAFDNVVFAKGKKEADRIVEGLSKLSHVSDITATEEQINDPAQTQAAE